MAMEPDKPEKQIAPSAPSATTSERCAETKLGFDIWNDDRTNDVLPNEAPNDDDDEPNTRGNWTGKYDFLLSLIGYSVGLGNVWRFPYLVYSNGGGAFLIPFVLMLIVVGLPLMFMELALGQYAALGPIAVYGRFSPLFKGLGYGMIVVSSIVMIYYNMIIAWTLYYLGASLSTQLPWANCDPAWSTDLCYSYEEAGRCSAINGTLYKRLCYDNKTELMAHTNGTEQPNWEKTPPAEEYFNKHVLKMSSGIEDIGQINPDLAVCLFAAWTIVFLCLFKGVKSSGKVVYFTALFPYMVLILLFVRGVTLPGASKGIYYYLMPKWHLLTGSQVWGDAAVQIFFTLSPSWGGLITLSSYNRFNNNCYRDALIVAISNILTSFFAGFVIFSIIGFLAHEMNVDVDKVIDQGAGLAFIVYPEVVARLLCAPLWSFLFFVMLLTLGLDSQFALMETVTTAIMDRFPRLRHFKLCVVLSVSVLGYAGGLLFTTNSGMFWLQLLDKYAANWSVLLIASCECILVAWCYGSQRFLNDIQGMIGRRGKVWNVFWTVMWSGVTPVILLFIFVFNLLEYKPVKHGSYVFPMWADAVGLTIGLLPVAVIIALAVGMLARAPRDRTLLENIRLLSRPTAEWGPSGRPVWMPVDLRAVSSYSSTTYTRNLIVDRMAPVGENSILAVSDLAVMR